MILLLPAAARAQTLTWDPNSTGSASGSDNSGSWDTTTSDWFNGGTLADTAWLNGADAVIGAGTTLTTGSFAPVITIDEPVGVQVNSITFNAVGAGSTTGYTIADSSGTGANSLLVGGSNAMTINNNAVGVTTTINANILSNGVNPFALNVLGGGNLAIGGSIGVNSGANNAAGTLRVGNTGSSTGYTGTLTLSGINRLSAVTINSGTVSAIPASLGSGPVTLAGGTLSIGVDPATSIAMHVATSQTGSSTVAFVYNTMTPSMSAAGVVPVAAGNWNNLLISRGSTPQKTAPGNSANTSSNHQSALPFALNGASGAATTAQVVDWWGSNTFSTSATNPNFASGTQQMFSSGLNANSAAVGDNQTSFTLSGIPYSSYNLYVYYGNNAAGAIGNAFLQTGSGTVTLPTRGAAPTGAQPGTYVAPTFQTATTPSGGYPVYFYNTGGATPPSTYARSVATTQASATVSNYVEWTGVTGSDFFVALKELAGGTPWISGLEIVPTSSTVSNPLSVTSSSTVNLGGSVSLTGGATIASSGTPTVLSVTGSGNFLDLTSSTTTLSGTGGTLSPAIGVLAKLGPISDGGNGFSTSGAGTVVLSADNTSTLTGPVRIGGVTQLAMSSTTTGSASGAGSVTIASGGLLTGNGIITPGTGNSMTVGSGGSIVGPASGSTLRVNGPTAINNGGLVQSSAGTLIFAGATTLNSGGSLAVGTGQLITASGSLTLAGGLSTFTVTSAATSSPFVNVLGGGASSLTVTGSNTISMLLSGNPNTQVGSTTTYDLFNYAGADLAPSRSGGTLSFAGGTLAVSSPASGGLPPADQLTLVDIAGSGGNPNMIELMVTVPGPLTWTGATNGNWDSATTNWAASSPVAPTQYVDGSTVTFADKNPITNANVVNSNITITPAQVNPASIIFTNSAVNYSFSGGSIGGASGGVTLNGTGSVTLNNNNTFIGAVAVNAGQLILGQAAALGNTPSVTVASGAGLVLNNTSGNSRTFSTPAAGSGTIPLSLGGAGVAASPAGALESLAGNNTYNGAITLTAPTTINSASAALGDGLTLGGTISTTAGNFGLTFTGAGNTTTSGAISGGGGLTMAGAGTLNLSGANTFTGAVQVNSGGTLRVLNSKGLGTSSAATVSSGGALALSGGISVGAIPLTLSGNGIASNPTGALTSTAGANLYAGAITLAGNTSIGSSSTTSGDALLLAGGINTTSNNFGLTFLGAGSTLPGAISGGGSVKMSGTGTLSLSSASTYSGGTIVGSGIVSVSNSNALGTGGVSLSGGTLQFTTNTLGLHIAADSGTVGSSSGEQPETIGTSAVAGVVPISNWNDFVVTRFLNGGDKSNTNLPSPQSVATTPTPLILNNSTGTTTTAQVTAWQSNNTFSVYGTPQANPNAQLVNGFIGSINNTSPPTFPAKVTVSSIPLDGYNVYVYFNNNLVGQNTQISLASGTYTSPTYYVATQGTAPLSNGNYTFTSGTASTSSSTYTPSNFVEISLPSVGTSGVTNSFTVTLSSATSGGNTPGIAAIEIVPSAGPPVVSNNITVTADSTIDVTGVNSATAGNLTIGAQTLSVTGGSVGAGAPYTMNLGTTTLTGNATFNVASNSSGSGAGTLRLGAVGDGGSGLGITINNGNATPGTVVLTAGGSYSGPTNIDGGTLVINGAVTGTGAVTVASAGNLSGPLASGGSGSMAGAVTVQNGGTIKAANGATFTLAGGLTLSDGSASLFNLSGTPNGTADPAAAMIIASGGGATSLVIGAAPGDTHTINLAGTPSPVQGTYNFDLISYAGGRLTSSGPSSGSTLAFTNAPGTLALGSATPPGPFAFQLVNNPSSNPNGGGQIDVQVTAYAESWTGLQGSLWDTPGQFKNFAAIAPTPFSAAYVDGATVFFGDNNIVQNSSLGSQSITIQSGGVRPAAVTFTNTGSANGGADYVLSNDTNPSTGQPDMVGIAGSTGITLNGNGSGLGGQVVLDGANSFTGPVHVNAGDLLLGVEAALGNSSGVSVASGAELDLNTGLIGTATTFGNLAGGPGTIPLTLAGAGLAGGHAGALNNASGKNTYTGPITLAAATTIASSSTAASDGLILSGGLSTTASGFGLTFSGVGNTTVSGAITGAGSLTYTGSATLTLSAANTYSGGTTISADTSNSGGLVVATNAAALGTGNVTISSGVLRIAAAGPAVSLANSFSITGPATIDITGPSAATIGPLQISGAALTVTGGSSGAGAPYSLSTGAVTLNGNAEFDVSDNSNGGGAGSLQLGAVGDGGHGYGLTINNGNPSPGTVTLLAGGSYGGPTNVNGGTLQVNGAVTGAGAVTVASGATLAGPSASGGAGSMAGAVTIQSNATIAGTNGATLALTHGLTLAGGSQSTFNLTGAPNGTANPAAALIATSGAGPTSLAVGSSSGDTHTVRLAGTPYAQPGTSTYDLISYTGTPLSATSPDNGVTLDFSSGTVMTLGSPLPSGPYSDFQLVNNPAAAGGQIDVKVTSYPITWAGGANNGAWDTSTINWTYAPPSGATGTNYVEGASVNFADLSLFGSTVSNVNGLATVNVQPNGVNPGSVAFTNTGAALGGVDYLINGGSIGGAATVLTKSGAGPVTINTSNAYGGGTVITGGTLVAAQPTSLGTGTVTLGGGALRLGSFLAGFGGTSAGVSGTSTWTVNSAGISSNPINSDVLTLTDNAGNESRSAFYNAPAPAVGGSSGFSARFVYTPSGNKAADGVAFILQNSSSGTGAIGASGAGNGGALGYGGAAGTAIAPSVAFEMNIFASNTIGVAWRSNGATGAPYSIVTPVNLAGGDPIQVQLSYNQANTTLTAVLTDTVTNATSTYTNSAINAASVLGQGTAFIGFSGADGGSTSTQTISGFSYATTGAYANNVLLSPATTSTIDLAASSLDSAYSMGSLTVGAGGTATLNVTASTATAGQPYSLALGDVTLNSSAIINVANNGAAAGTLSLGAVGDGGAGKGITVGGPGTVVLTAGGSYGGPTTINGGVLRVNGAVTGTGAIAVNNGGTLSGPLAAGGAGSMAGAVTLNNGGSITASGVAAFSLSGGLTLATGSSSNFILNASPNGAGSGIGLVATSSSSDRSLVINGSHTVNLAGTVPAVPGNYTYDLFSYTGPSLASSGASSGSTLAFTNAAGSLTLGSLPPGGLGSYQLVNNPNGSSGGQIDLAVTTYALAWTGANSSAWDTATQNWAVASPSPTPSVFTNGNPVVFGDTSPLTNQTVSNSTITVQAGGVQPLSMTFTNSGTPNGVNYTIGGGPIGGSGGITLNGAGSVALAGANTFTGPVQLNAGTLIIGSDALSSGSSSAAPLGAVSATAANDIFINGGTLRANVVPSATTAGTFTLNANRGIALGSTRGAGGTGTIDVTSGTGLIYGGSIANAGSGSGALVKSSPGTLVLGGNSGYSGGTTVSGGTLALGLSNNPAGSGPITLAGGNLQLYGQTSGSPAAGLAAAFYAGSSSLSTAGTSDPNLASLSALLTHFSSQTPAATALTTTGGMTSLNWPNVGAGNLFQSTQGYTGTVNYEAILAGTLTIAQGGSYTFQTGSDDGSVLYLDGSPTPLVNNNGNHGFQTVNSSAITLSPGVHSLVVGYYQGGGGAQLSVSYNGPDTANNLSVIPDTALLTSSASGFPSVSQAYSNNVSLTSNATINVTGSLAASVGTLGLSGSTMSLTSGDLSASPYSLTVAGLNVSGASGVSVAASSSGGAGVLQVTAPSTFASGAALNIAAGKVRFNVTSGTATVGAGATATVSSGATLELAGSVSALANGANRVNIVNNSSAGGLVVSGTSQVVGNIDGNGTTQVNAGSDLTANHIVQSALIIGGTAGSPALVTIDASDASGNSLAGSGSSLALADSLKPSAPLAAGAAGSSGLLAASDVGAKASSTASANTLAGSASVGGTAAVPEPSSWGLALLAAIGFGVVIAAQGRKAAR